MSKTLTCRLAPAKPDTTAKAQLVRRLQQKINRTETYGRNDDGTIISSGSPFIDSLLPNGGYKRGTVVEWLADSGTGAEYLSLTTARQAALEGGAVVIADADGHFYPPAAAALGINLGNLILLRDTGTALHPNGGSQNHPNLGGRGSCRDKTSYSANLQHSSSGLDSDDFLWAINQSLRCPAVAVVWGRLPEFPDPLTRERWLRRFQLSAESSGCMGLFIHPANQLGRPSWSEVQWWIQNEARKYPTPTWNSTLHIPLTLVRCRGSSAGQTLVLDINTISGNISHATPQNQKPPYTSSVTSSVTARTSSNTSTTTGPQRKFTRPLRPTRALSVATQLAHSKNRRRSAGA